MTSVRRTTQLATVLVLLLMLSMPRPSTAQKALAEAPKDLAAKISDSALKQQKRRIAVIPFRGLDGSNSVLGTYLAEELVTELFKVGSLDIVERTMLDRILQEMRLARSGIIDPSSAKQIGKIAGVDAVVTGTVTDLQSFAGVNCRLIDVQTGRVFAAASTKIVKDADVEKVLRSETNAEPSKAAGSIHGERTRGAGPQVPRGAKAQDVTEKEFSFHLRGCKRSGTSLVCELAVTNLGEDAELHLYVKARAVSRAFDDEGNEYLAQRARLGADTGTSFANATLISGVATRASISFEGIPRGVSKLTVLELVWFSRAQGRGHILVQFRDVLLDGE